jgi:hypothetical protein
MAQSQFARKGVTVSILGLCARIWGDPRFMGFSLRGVPRPNGLRGRQESLNVIIGRPFGVFPRSQNQGFSPRGSELPNRLPAARRSAVFVTPREPPEQQAASPRQAPRQSWPTPRVDREAFRFNRLRSLASVHPGSAWRVLRSADGSRSDAFSRAA